MVIASRWPTARPVNSSGWLSGRPCNSATRVGPELQRTLLLGGPLGSGEPRPGQLVSRLTGAGVAMARAGPPMRVAGLPIAAAGQHVIGASQLIMTT